MFMIPISKILFAYKVTIKNVQKIIQMPLNMYIFFETLNMMHLKSYLEKTLMNFLWGLTKKTNSILYSPTNERIDEMVTIVNFLKTHHYIANGCVLCH